MMKRIMTLLALCVSVFQLNAAELFLECESFREKGGWKIDQQFMDVMGSPYLLAHGMGCPVKDAVTEIAFPQTGRYHVYVRTYNWTSPWHDGKGPGKFCLVIDNKRLKTILGDEGKAWMWQPAGSIDIKKLNSEVRIHDLTGFDGRCDAIFFTTEEGACPPSDVDDLDTFRRKLLQIPDTAPMAGEYDLVVVGAGIAGMSAAASAARLGCKVALINDRPVVGGNNSSEIRVHLGGRIDVGPYPELGGMQKEFGPSKGGNAKPAENYEDDKKLKWLQNEPNISLFLNYRLIAVEKDGDRIASITAKNIEDGSELNFRAEYFSDCTGDGTLGYLAGADYRIGREARDEFEEDLAPETADKRTLGASVQWYSVETQKPSSFPDFEYGLSFNEKNCQKVKMGEWTWETGMDKDQIHDFEKVRDYGILVIYSNWSFLKNKLKDNKEFRNRSLGWVAYIAGKRESRRLMGDYILSEQDITKQVFHEDASFTTTWSIDLHSPNKQNSLDFPGQEFIADCHQTAIHPYSVPYRCLYSRNICNMFMAGRDISVTHVALGSVRVMRTTGMMGEVVGMAASICKKYGITPRAVYYYHLNDLKELMKKGVNKKGLPNNQTYNVPRSLE